MSTLYLCTFEGARSGLMNDLQSGLALSLDTEVVAVRSTLPLEPFYSCDRSQYNSTQLIAQLRLKRPRGTDDGVPLLAVVHQDLFIPPLTFVFGEAELGGLNAVISSCRLENERYGLPADGGLLRERLVKESLHEIGHLGGLTHCFEQRCVMKFSTSVEEIDLKSSDYCGVCRDALSDVFPLRTPADSSLRAVD